jgi:hypothetical protein
MTKKSMFFPNIAASPEPLTTAQKFKLFVNESISPSVLLTAGISAGFGQATNSPAGYGQGAEGYGKRYGSSLARGASSSFFGTFVLASALHQDPRFFPRSHPTFWNTLGYSAKCLVITRSDSGRQVFNTSGLMGPLLGESLANAYMPAAEQTAGRTFTRYAGDLGWRFAGNVFKEYWPTIFKSMGLNQLKIIPPPSTGTH